MNILNVINFVRAVEPRNPNLDLVLPVKKQLELSKKYNLPTTFLLQYDTICDDKFLKLFEGKKNIELGVWLEIVQPLTEAVGIPWTGREGFAWDWHAHCGFSVGYTPDQRKLLIDEVMRKFKEVFGYYPKSVASWAIDAVTLKYLYEKYNISASAICRDQCGTDGYTLWGGYYNQAYYPCFNNALSPAQSLENQINVPVFRMLGSDPIEQYDINAFGSHKVASLEPSSLQCGGNKEWVEWFFDNIYNDKTLSFGYTQAGQENSFGWPLMSTGYELQMEIIAKLAADGKITPMLLCDTGEWYKENYKTSPASATSAETEDKQSYWYYNTNYRVNLLLEKDNSKIRDIHIFNDDYKERYFDEVATSEALIFDTLPVIDGRWWKENSISGMYFTANGKNVILSKNSDAIYENDELKLSLSADNGSSVTFECKEKELIISTDLDLTFVYNELDENTVLAVKNDGLAYSFRGFEYSVEIAGELTAENGSIKISPIEGKIVFAF